LTLADGTKVWMNAASSMRYPTLFIGNERKVEITGEAYFEVAKNTSMPFKVNVAGKGEVEVLGTHFNINSYGDEPTINTTLLEGRVKMASLTTDDLQFITPGQQACLNSKGQIDLNKNPDIEEVMAWKNGKFQFGEKMDVQAIMRQIARWYDVEVEYKGTVNGSIGGSISRDVNISIVLSMLEKTGEVKFRIEGNKVTVLP
jgi:ferric-dicitrate binding protein FerR (iron transport regulator)